MSLQYEFLSYESFPEDQYVKEVVMVSFGGTLIFPYQNVMMKNGGSFWCFPGMSATVGGTKKRFNGEFDVKSAKIKFEQDLEAFIRSRAPSSTQQPLQFNSQGIAQQKGAGNEDPLPF